MVQIGNQIVKIHSRWYWPINGQIYKCNCKHWWTHKRRKAILRWTEFSGWRFLDDNAQLPHDWSVDKFIIEKVAWQRFGIKV
jgi:hypothetical protein